MLHLPTIQIHIVINYTLSAYYQKKKIGNTLIEEIESTSNFNERCPICQRKNCVKFLEYYYREVIDENGTYYKRFPIARYICTSKSSGSKSDRTFSLLPYQLIPYKKYSIPYIFKLLEKRVLENMSIKQILDYLSELNTDHLINLSPKVIISLIKLIQETIEKLLISNHYKELSKSLQTAPVKAHLQIFIEYAASFETNKTDPVIRGPCGLSYDYYCENGGYYMNSPFLIGTPYQFRKKR